MQKIMNRRTFLSAGVSVAGMAVAGGSASVYAYQIEPAWIEITAQPIRLPRLGSRFDNYRIVQISDLHVDLAWMNRLRMKQLVQLVNEQQADLVVITGDFITSDANEQRLDALIPLRSLQAKDGVFYVLGNHDHWSGPASIRSTLQAVGMHELRDSTHTITRGSDMLHLVGLDDLWPISTYIAPIWSHRGRLTSVLKGLPAGGAALLLVHEPDFADVAASTGRIDLQLSGHSHGGQISLPFYGAIVTPPLGQRYPSGMYRIGDMQHYTNRGIGMVSPRVRFNCRPEITVFTCNATQA